MIFKSTVKNLIESNQKSTNKSFVAAIIVAAGRGTRMQTDINKQVLPISGIPVIARTISSFEKCRDINEIVVVTNADTMVMIAQIIREFGFKKVVRIVRGGRTRQQSANEGLKAVSAQTQFVAVHDGARPLILPADISKVVEAAFEKDAAAAASPVKDTIKIADENGMVKSTPERAGLWLIQTPQVFNIRLYREALEKALENGADFTDDCQLFENEGRPVQLVKCDYTNIKITTQDDIAIAESILRTRSD